MIYGLFDEFLQLFIFQREKKLPRYDFGASADIVTRGGTKPISSKNDGLEMTNNEPK